MLLEMYMEYSSVVRTSMFEQRDNVQLFLLYEVFLLKEEHLVCAYKTIFSLY